MCLLARGWLFALIWSALGASALAQNIQAGPTAMPTVQIIPEPGSPGGALGVAPETIAERDLYLRRLGVLTSIAGAGDTTALYDPLEVVHGDPRHRALRRAHRSSISAEALQAAREYAERNNSSALLVWRRGRLELEQYFGGATAQSELVSRSLAKPLSAVAIGRAIQLGAIDSLDQPVVDFIPEWAGDPRRSRILVRHLLDMRTGFLRQGFSASPEDVLNRAYLHPRHDEVIVTEYPVPDEPGSVFEYNNASSELVALVIERATRQRYADFVSREIIQRVGGPGGRIWLNREEGVAHSGCCFLAPAELWVRLGVLLLNDGVWHGRRLLPEGYVAEMRTPTLQNQYFGLGIYVAGAYVERRGWTNPQTTPYPGVWHSEPYLAADLFLFDGAANQVVYIVPSEQLVIARLGGPPVRGQGAPEWDNSFLPNTIIRGIANRRGRVGPQAR